MCLAIVWTMMSPSPLLEPIIIVWILYAMNELKPKACDWTLLGMETQNCFLNHSKPTTWAYQRCIRMINIKSQKLTRYMPSKCKPKPFHHNQGSSPPSLKHPKWIKNKQVAQLCLTPHLVATSWLSLKFVCLFHVSMFLWILKIHVAFDVLCSCIYFLKKIQKKNSKFFFFKISKCFPKNEKNFQIKKKSLWTRDIEPLSHFF